MTLLLLFLACLPLGVSAQLLQPPGDSKDVAVFESLIQNGDFTAAEAGLENYTTLHPNSWRAQYQLGYVEFRLHRIQSSVERLCKSLILNSAFAESHKILAYDLNILGHPDRAILELQRGLSLDSTSAESHYELGRIYYEQGDYLQAIVQLEQAKTLASDSVRTYHNLGLAYAAISENEKAVDNFEEGLRRNRAQARLSAWPLIDYGTYLNLRGEFSRAREMMLQAIAIDPQWDQAFDELSKADRGLGRTSDAIDALQHALALNSSKSEYHYVLARLFEQTGELTEAQKQLAMYRTAHRAARKP